MSSSTIQPSMLVDAAVRWTALHVAHAASGLCRVHRPTGRSTLRQRLQCRVRLPHWCLLARLVVQR